MRKRPIYLQSKRQKRETQNRFRAIGERVGRYKGHCLFPGSGKGGLCKESPSKCHVIPEKSVLSKLKGEKSGKVLEFDWGVGQWKDLLLRSGPESQINLEDPATFKPRELGTGDACIGLFACDDHDNIFNPRLDTNIPDFDSPELRWLAMGRAILYAADLASKRKFLADDWSSEFMRGNPKERVLWAGEKEAAGKTYRVAHSEAGRWGSNWHSAARGGGWPPDAVDWRTLAVRSSLTFAACVFYGEATVVIVFPRGDVHHEMTILHFQEDASRVKEDEGRLTQMASDIQKSDAYGVQVISELMSGGNGAAAASPASYNDLREEDKLTMQRILMEKLRIRAMPGLGRNS